MNLIIVIGNLHRILADRRSSELLIDLLLLTPTLGVVSWDVAVGSYADAVAAMGPEVICSGMVLGEVSRIFLIDPKLEEKVNLR